MRIVSGNPAAKDSQHAPAQFRSFLLKPILRVAPLVIVGMLVLGWTGLLERSVLADDKNQLPAAVKEKIDFHKDVLPILNRRCALCHAGGKSEGGLSIETRKQLLAGGDSGASLKVGHSDQSLLIELVAGHDPDRVMPVQGKRLNQREIGLLRGWIDQGLVWPAGLTLRKILLTSWKPRKPKLPSATGELKNPIDRLLAPYFLSTKQTVTQPVSDRVYVRRVYQDVIGLLPTPEEIQAFVADSRKNKRARLVDRLLHNNRQYAIHWMTFWNDALRNDYRGTGYIDGGRRQISNWLYSSLAANMPYNEFVRQLIDPPKGAEGFIKGIVWRGTVNASQRPEMQAAQNISQVFLGINLKCASCHDSFISNWRLKDSYALATVFAQKPLEMHRCNKPTGEFVKARFLNPDLGTIDPAATRKTRLTQLAAAMTSPANGRLTRTMVNRIWQRLLGRGMIEPVDEMDNLPWNADLLDYLAADLGDHGYDLKYTMRMILTSHAYQLPSIGMKQNEGDAYVFRGPTVRRMSAEQFVDAVIQLTGNWNAKSQVALPPIESGKKTPARAALISANSMMRILGRPNREQIVTSRPKLLTTLQALELTNGATLDTMLRRGAAQWLARSNSREKLVEAIYLQALGRHPSKAEMEVALETIGEKPNQQSVADLLWIVTMLPEFQLIY